ncbi:MAG: L,D-transpeptidase [Akkermansiaceae bacterium]|nr:L,D-transpeptidase [Akkermansiaceae bacterium]
MSTKQILLASGLCAGLGWASLLAEEDQAVEVVTAGPVFADPLPADALPADPVKVSPAAVIDAAVVPDEGEGNEMNDTARKSEAEGNLLAGDTGVPTDRDLAVRLQMFLDQKLFGPGFIDGKPGNFTTKAVHAYNRSVGRTPGDWGALVEEADAALGETYATAIVPEIAEAYVNPKLPKRREDQAKLKRMAYTSYLEFMAERYHTSESFLIELNGSKKCYGLAPRKDLRVPNIEPFRIELLEEGQVNREDEVLSGRSVIIDTKAKTLFIYGPGEAPVLPGGAVVIAEEDHTPQVLLAMFPITPGKSQFIHHGEWAIANSVVLPKWSYDKEFLETGQRSKDKSKIFQIPSGPNNPVGIIWNGLTKSGIGIHGTSSPRTIGRSRSAGCIRLSNWDAARFPELVRPGAKVEVR